MNKVINILRKYKNKYSMLNVAVKASICFTICSFIQKGISVLTMPIFTRIMSTEQYGNYTIFLTWYNILLLIVTLNIHSEVFNKGLAEHSDNMDKYTANQSGLLLVLIFLFSIIYAIFYPFLKKIICIPAYLIVIMFAEIWANAMIGFWYAQKRFEYKYKKIAVVTLLNAILVPILGIVAVINSSQKAEAKIITNAIVPIVIAIFLFINYVRKYKLFSDLKFWKKTIILCLPLVPHYLSLVLLNQSDKLMINYFSGAANAAIYSVAHSAGLFMVLVNNSINNSFVPWCYNKLKNNDNKKIKNIINIILLIVFLVNLVLIWIAPELIKLLASKDYTMAKWCLVPIAVSVFFQFLYTLFVDFEIYYEKNHYIAIASFVATFTNIILNYFFISKYGFLAAGYTTLISYVFTAFLHYLFLNKILKKDKLHINHFFDTKIIFALSILLFLLSALAMILYNFTLIRFLIVLIIFIIAFFNKDKIINIFKEMKGDR